MQYERMSNTRMLGHSTPLTHFVVGISQVSGAVTDARRRHRIQFHLNLLSTPSIYYSLVVIIYKRTTANCDELF
jgi:hypothetical protein